MLIRKGDMVRVVTGDDKGATGKVLRVLRDENKLVVEGINRVYRHLKPSRRNPQGGRLSKEMPVDVSERHAHRPGLEQADAHRRSHPGRRQQGTVREEVRGVAGPDRQGESRRHNPSENRRVGNPLDSGERPPRRKGRARWRKTRATRPKKRPARKTKPKGDKHAKGDKAPKGDKGRRGGEAAADAARPKGADRRRARLAGQLQEGNRRRPSARSSAGPTR